MAETSTETALTSDEAILEGRLLAPCCYVQTLDIHASPLASELRAEIHTRLLAGEPAAAVETALIARYGDTIRAAPHGADSRLAIGALGIFGALAGIFWITRVTKKWGANSTKPPLTQGREASSVALADAQRLDARLDEELARLDD